ncbi:DUF4041 domain-containing protein [Pseudokineococcus lusitanus]|uniref:DUF4041 domain-containing protein n=1 Tax=Pseudokineococcus lusitanus TaxID=763993 RepID=UPI0018F5169F|nr:DUF4041 domain-containing protein [Pseudokineococcus lusitanus]
MLFVDDDSRRADHRPGAATGGAVVDGATRPVAVTPPDEKTVKAPTHEAKVGIFGARKQARSLLEERAALQADVERLRGDLRRLGVLEVVDLERRRDALAREIVEQERRQRDAVAAHQAELDAATTAARATSDERLADVRRQLDEAETRLAGAREQVVVTEDLAVLQEAGVYTYRHPLTDAVGYRSELARVSDSIKAMTRKDGGAITAATGWTVNGSAAQGRAMVRDFSKLMLRAYNAEADVQVRNLKPYKLESSTARLEKVVATIERLGKTMDIRIAPAYHRLRLKELALTADYMEKLAEEKAREREEKERLREERKVEQEIERERLRLQKERQHYANALASLEASGDLDGVARLREQVDDLDKAIADVDYRAANVRAGYVYVISNLGAFGPGMVKVGMTRRLEPMDRVRELSDASVPFNFDVHALFFAEDAVGIEAAMHKRLGDRRVNRVNHRREFFYATPAEAREHLAALSGDLLQYEELAEALEYRQSHRDSSGGATVMPSSPA